MPPNLEHKVAGNTPAKYRSEGERRIASVLDQYGIPFVYEPSLHISAQNRPRLYRPDFYLPTHNLYVEYFGRVGNHDYDQRTTQKLAAYEANNLNVLPLFPWHLAQNWPNELLDQLRSPDPIRRQHHPARQYPVSPNTTSFYHRFQPKASCSYRRCSSRAYR